jgi:NAD-dependent dihydropyrimidine dehydrogenase PreA subunit
MTEGENPDRKPDRGQLRIDEEECKGCGLCIEACPPKVISLSERLNHYGYRTAVYAGSRCTACGICFMVCPEPGAITVMRLVNQGVLSQVPKGEGPGAPNVGGASVCANN